MFNKKTVFRHLILHKVKNSKYNIRNQYLYIKYNINIFMYELNVLGNSYRLYIKNEIEDILKKINGFYCWRALLFNQCISQSER